MPCTYLVVRTLLESTHGLPRFSTKFFIITHKQVSKSFLAMIWLLFDNAWSGKTSSSVVGNNTSAFTYIDGGMLSVSKWFQKC